MTDNSRYLFRGKRLDNGEWVQGSYVCAELLNGSGFEHFIIEVPATGRTIDIDPSTLGQSTGLKDKNGTLIFEHDILEYVINNKSVKFVLKWCNISLSYRAYDSLDEKYHGELFSITNAVFGDCLVIGNIIDNGMVVNSDG